MNGTAFYNDIDPFCCNWLRNLVDAGELPPGHVEQRSIMNVQAKDVERFTQAHWFCGIGGWPLALRMAGWPADAPVWTASLPCQPLSCAGKQRGDADERHLWPAFFRLVRECSPAIIFGEQVASKDGLEWLDGVFADLEDAHYTCGAADLCAAGVGAPHIRQRLYWVAVANGGGSQERRTKDDGIVRGCVGERSGLANVGTEVAESSNRIDGLANAERDGRRSDKPQRGPEGRTLDGWPNPWSAYSLVNCRDGRNRRISAQSSDEPLAARLPRSVGQIGTREQRMELLAAKANRVGRLKWYGNAICPQVATEFVRAFMETCNVG